jgi:hypothetical protein
MFRRRQRADRSAERSAEEQWAAWAAGLDSPWREIVQRALESQARYREILATVPDGPTRTRLVELQAVIDDAVQKVGDTVDRAIRARQVAATLDVERATDELKRARRDLEAMKGGGGDTSSQERLVETLATRHRAMHDAINLTDDAAGELRELNIRLETAVAHASTIVLRSQLDLPDELERELDEVIVGLATLDSSLRQLGD